MGTNNTVHHSILVGGIYK